MIRHVSVSLVVVTGLALSSCAKKAPEALPPAPAANLAEAPHTQTGIVPGSQADFVNQMRGQDVIYFDTDRYNVDEIDAAALRSQAQWLARYPSKRASIQGHADERGTREYNLGLGERRANATKNYLASLGIDASRLTTISYGKERPVDLGSDEASRAKNRRAVTVTID